MGVAERKEREKQELRERIVSAATALFLENGIEKTSIRMIAERIEYSPATIYLYFKDKNELFYEIMDRAFSLFFEYFSRVGHIQDPMERIKALGKVYLQFVADQPFYYDLMFVIRAPMETQHTHETWPNGQRSHEVLTNAVQECIDAGHFQGHDPEALSLAIWSGVHGMATLKIRQRLSMYPEERQETLVDEALKSFNMMLDNA